jgi:hypothetical protein
MSTNSNLLGFPARPLGVKPRVADDFTKEYITVHGYNSSVARILGTTIDDVEIKVTLETYERMERDPTVAKIKRILTTNTLSDELQFAPGATEDEVGEGEYETYVQVMEFCQRMIGGLDRHYRETLEQILGNGIRYGHGIAEVEWEYRQDGPNTRPAESRTPKTKKTGLGAFAAKLAFWRAADRIEAEAQEGEEGIAPIKRPILTEQKTRLMPKSIKVKPRGAARFVVDDYMTVLGLAPRNRGGAVKVGEVVSRDKFLVFTLNKTDEDPRGRSMYRPIFNWYNLKQQIPAEMLRFILEEAVPKAVGTLPEHPVPFEHERDEHNNIVYEDPDTKLIPKMLTAAEAFRRQIKGFRSGSGAVIPYGAKLEPYRKAAGAGDADFFPKMLDTLDQQMENGTLLQTLAQSEGEHQARAASQEAKDILNSFVFYLRLLLAVMTLIDLCEVGVRMNLGEWALRYMPQVSLGDFVRRDWAKDLQTLADAYFKGFIDDTQRPEIMAWLNLPKAGPSRQELMAEVDPTTGAPTMPNKQRPDKAPANNRRNNGNGTEKKRDATTRFSPLNALGHHGRRFARSTGNLFTGPRQG